MNFTAKPQRPQMLLSYTFAVFARYGIIISPPFSADYTHIQQAADLIPLIVLERRVPKVECVVTNNEEVAHEAVSHLVGHGYKKIGVVKSSLMIRHSCGC